jgi:hypothetical protein
LLVFRQELARAGAVQVFEQVLAVPPGAVYPDLHDPGIDGFGRRVDSDAAGGIERGHYFLAVFYCRDWKPKQQATFIGAFFGMDAAMLVVFAGLLE